MIGLSKELTIQLAAKDDHLTVGSLVAALEKALALLKAIDPNEEWEVVRVTKNSPLKIVVRSPSSDRIAPKYMNGLRKLDRKTSTRGHAALDTRALRASKEFFDVLRDGFNGIRLSFPGTRPVNITPQVVRNVKMAAKRSIKYRIELTSIRGDLFQVTWGKSDQRCRIRELLTGNEIPCVIPPELWKEIKDALPARVDVFGAAKTSLFGIVSRMNVEKVRFLSKPSRSMEETPAINITDGRDAREHIERLRGAD